MTALDLTGIAKEIYECSRRLSNVGDGLFKLSEEMAATERDYKKSLAMKAAQLKADHTPTTLIPDLAKGDPEVAEMMYKKILAEARYTSGRDNVDAIASQLSALQTIFKRFDEI